MSATEQKQQISGLTSLLVAQRDFIAGCGAGIACALIGQPFDTIKVRMQSSTNGESLVKVVSSLFKNEGPLALYKGVFSPLISLSFIESIRFGAQQTSYRFFNSITKPQTDNDFVLNYALAGSFGSIVAAVPTTPMELVRIKMQLLKGDNGKYSNTVQCFNYIRKNYGIRGLFTGFNSCMVRDGFGYFFYFGTYEMGTRFLKKKILDPSISESEQTSKVRVAQILSGIVSGIVLWSSIYPIDNIKSRIQGDSIAKPRYSSILNAIQQHSMKELTAGLSVCLIRAGVANAGVFFTFEFTKSTIDSMNPNLKH